MQNDIISRVLTATTNWVVTNSCIDKNWKLEDWNDKIERRLKWKNVKVRGSVLHFCLIYICGQFCGGTMNSYGLAW